MEEQIERGSHGHVRISVDNDGGYEWVPAEKGEAGHWILLRSPLYAMRLAAGDTLKIANEEPGTFEIVDRGGNIAVQFYLPETDCDDPLATKLVIDRITPEVELLSGRLDGQTTGSMVFTLPMEAGFQAIESVFARAVQEFEGAQWQYANVYDPITGKPLMWWK